MKTFFPESFNFKQHITPDKKIKQLKILRGIGFITHMVILFSNYFTLNSPRVFYFYTTWGIIMTMLNFLFSFLSTYFNEDSSAKVHYHKFCYVFFEIAWTSEAVITIFFWLVLTWTLPAEAWNIRMVLVMLLLHLYPFAMLCVDFLITKMTFRVNHVLFIMIPPILYMFLSIYLSLVHDIVLYNVVLTWKDIITLFSVILLVSLFIGVFMCGYYIGKKMFKRTEDYEITMHTNESSKPY